jgi:hypothetical protein
MAPALILSEQKAAERGFTGEGPFTLGGAFPGIYSVGQPLALSELGFQSEGEAREAFDEAFGDDAPLEWTTVEEGEGLAPKDNHALSEIEFVELVAEEGERDEGGHKITTHAQADEVAESLGIEFPKGSKMTVADKIRTIEEVRAGHGGDPDALTPAPGAEDSTPGPPEEEPDA